jgi:hypothetical protein
MTQHESLADAAVAALAAVSAMTEGVTNDHPERHVIRQLKHHAENDLAAAFRRARAVAYLVDDLRKLAQPAEPPG